MLWFGMALGKGSNAGPSPGTGTGLLQSYIAMAACIDLGAAFPQTYAPGIGYWSGLSCCRNP